VKVFAAALISLGLLFLAGCAAEDGGPPARSAPMVPVSLATVGPEEFMTRIEALGTTRARESVEITALVTDRIVALNFRDGQYVEAGQELVRLGGGEELGRLAEARVNLETQKRELRRIEGLVRQNLASVQSLDTQKSAVEEARARLVGAEARVAERLITAPFSGELGLRKVSPGALVTPGTVITTLDDTAVMHLDFSVPEVFLADVGVGQEVQAHSAAYPQRVFEGEVVQIDSRVDPVTRAFTIRAELPNPDGVLKPGMLLTLSLIMGRTEALSVPEMAIVPSGEGQFVYVFHAEDRFERRPVQIGRRMPGRVEILDGLEDGEQIITEGMLLLRPGARLKVIRVDGEPVADDGVAAQ